MLFVTVTHGLGDLGDAVLAVEQERLGLFNAQPVYICRQREAHFLLEEVAEVWRRDEYLRGYLAQRQVLAVMAVDIVDGGGDDGGAPLGAVELLPCVAGAAVQGLESCP